MRDGLTTLRFNIAIARITELTNHLTAAYGAASPVPRSVVEPLVLMVAPLAPHLAEELWSRLGHSESLAWAPFPVADERWLVDDTVQVAVQVNGKVRSQVTVPADADAAVLEAAARADEKIAARLEGATVRRVVAVPGRLVNFVLLTCETSSSSGRHRGQEASPARVEPLRRACAETLRRSTRRDPASSAARCAGARAARRAAASAGATAARCGGPA